jgi:hypothetical protein
MPTCVGHSCTALCRMQSADADILSHCDISF